jgi:hypothetical protein
VPHRGERWGTQAGPAADWPRRASHGPPRRALTAGAGRATGLAGEAQPGLATARATQAGRRAARLAAAPTGGWGCSTNENGGEECMGKRTHLVTVVLHGCDLDMRRDEELNDETGWIYIKKVWEGVTKFSADLVNG